MYYEKGLDVTLLARTSTTFDAQAKAAVLSWQRSARRPSKNVRDGQLVSQHPARGRGIAFKARSRQTQREPV